MTTTPRKYVQLSEVQWAEAKALYESGGATLDQIAEVYGTSKRTLQRRFKNDEVQKGRTLIETTRVAAKRVSVEAGLTADDLAHLIQQEKITCIKINEAIRKRVIQVLRHDPDDLTVAIQANACLRNLDLASKTLARLHANQRGILGMDNKLPTDIELPELVFRIVPDDVIRAETKARHREIQISDVAEIAPAREEKVT